LIALSALLSGSAWLAAGAPSDDYVSATRPTLFGVNLATGSFAPEKLPGVHGKDYLYPTRDTAAPFAAMGMNTVRLPVIWERLQPTAKGELAPAELERLDKAIADLSPFTVVILDVHNYGRYRGRMLDPTDGSGALLSDLWTRLANRYKVSPRVAFGIMNEPHDIDAGAWRAIVDGTVAAIRRTGARNLLLIPGTRWTGGHSWFEGGARSNAAQLAGLKDPANNFLFEIHQYFDEDSSGTGRNCVSRTVGRERLRGVTAWLRKEKAKGLLGEFGAAPSPQCLAALEDVLGYLDARGDAWAGWTYWAAGEWWGDYPYSIQPGPGGAKPQSAVLKRHIR
jgi:endoglucanase